MVRYSKSRRLVERVVVTDQLEDLALDFVETAVGRYHFPASWTKLSRHIQTVMAEGWLHGRGVRFITAEMLVGRIDKLADAKVLWKN